LKRNLKESKKDPGKQHVILIDADEETQSAAAGALKAAGYEVHAYSDAKRVMNLLESKVGKLLNEWKPTVIITDVSLPDLGGFEFVRRVLSSSVAPEVPLLMMSRYQCVEDKADAYNTGAHGMLTKPITAEAVKQAVDEYRDRKVRAKDQQIIWGGTKSQF
jgi:DNA-binding response OmpR family regulator